MKKYMIRFESSSGSLAIEKAMHTYIRENYADCIVAESAIDGIVDDLKEQVNKYLESHRGKAVEVFCHKNGVTDGYFISVGSLTMCLIAIKRELGETFKQLSEPSYIGEVIEQVKKKYYDAGHKAGASQTVDKACKWLSDTFPDCYIDDETIEDDFRKAMEE